MSSVKIEKDTRTSKNGVASNKGRDIENVSDSQLKHLTAQATTYKPITKETYLYWYELMVLMPGERRERRARVLHTKADCAR